MILHVYANYNVPAGFFGPFIIERIEPEEMIKDYAQIICNYDKKTLKMLSELDLYYFGKFDNVSGEFTPEKTFLLHCGEVASRFIKEADDNGKIS